jgi:hypothetical protein
MSDGTDYEKMAIDAAQRMQESGMNFALVSECPDLRTSHLPPELRSYFYTSLTARKLAGARLRGLVLYRCSRRLRQFAYPRLIRGAKLVEIASPAEAEFIGQGT